MGLPLEIDSRFPSSSARSSMRSAICHIMRPLSPPVIVDHGPPVNAVCADSTASATSDSPALAMLAMHFPVAGFSTSNRSPLLAGRHSPWISRSYLRVSSRVKAGTSGSEFQ